MCSHHPVAQELNGHRVPLAVRSRRRTPHVAWGTRAAGIQRGLDEEVVRLDVDDGIVVPGRSGHQPEVGRAVEPEVEPDEGIFEIRVFIKHPFVLPGKFIVPEDPIPGLPFLFHPPVIAYLSFREMVAEEEVAGISQEGAGRCPGTGALTPFGQFQLEGADFSRMLPGEVFCF